MKTLLLTVSALAAVGLAAACSDPIDAGGELSQDTVYEDPLAVKDEAAPGSFDDLYRRVIVSSCSGQAGLCHNGQFEPNLSTPALAWANLVERPSLEKADKHRVTPGDSTHSLLIDKLRNRDVISQMPLGAKPLADADIAAFEQWIDGGALRSPEAEPVEPIDNPPEEPTLGIFDPQDERLDVSGSASVSPGTEVVLRMTTHDFETPDAQIPYAFFLLQTIYGDAVVIDPTAPAGQDYVAYASPDPNGPELGSEQFDWEYHWVVPDEVTLYLVAGGQSQVPTDGMSFLLVGGYADNSPAQAMALNFTIDALRVQQ